MPKEKIYDIAQIFNVEVGWYSEGPVQLGVTTHSGDPLYELPHDPSLTGVWSCLDREGINRLIRALRKARDQAYGADA